MRAKGATVSAVRGTIAVGLSALLLASAVGCTTNFNRQDAGATGNPADDVAAIDKRLEGNIYVEAAQKSGEGSNTCEVTKSAGEDINIVFSIEGLSNRFLTAQADAAKAAGEKLGVNVDVISGEDNISAQVSGVEDALVKGYDGLVLMPATTQGLQPALQAYTDQQVPYAFAGKGMDGVTPVTQVLGPFSEEGRVIGEYVVDHFQDEEGPVKVGIISGIPGDESSVARVESFKRSLAADDKFEIVAEQPGEYRRQQSQDAMDTILAANPDMQLVFVANDDGALGAIDAIKAAGLAGDIEVVGIDGMPDMFAAIEKGDALATVQQFPTAGEAVTLLTNCIRGEEVPDFKLLPGQVVDKDNVATTDPVF